MLIALCQAAGRRGDIAANLMSVRNAASEAADEDAALVVFPECFLTGYYNPDRAEELAIGAEDAPMRELCAIAAKTGIAIVCGLYERHAGSIHNSAMLVGPDGRLMTAYRKKHLFGAWERSVFTAGADGAVVTLGDLKLGLLICYDVEFPEEARRLARAGAELIVVPTALMEPAGVIPTVLVPARAAENQIFVAYANRVGQEDHLNFVGQSCIVGPDGRDLARADERGETLLFGRISTAAIARVREQACYLDDLNRT